MAVYFGMFDLTILNTPNSLGQLITLVILLATNLPQINKFIYKPFMVFIAYFVMGLILSLYHGESSYHYVFVIIKTGLIILNSLIIAHLLINYVNAKEIVNFIFVVFLIQTLSLLLYSVDLYQAFRGFFLSARSDHLFDNFGTSYWYRDATLSNQGYSGYALGALPLVIIAVHSIMMTRVISFKYIVAVISCGLGVAIAMVNGRSVFLFIPLYMLYLSLRPRELLLSYKIFPVLLLISMLVIIALTYFNISSSFVLAFFEQKGSSYGIDSVDDLMKNHTILHFEVTMFGIGKYLLSDGSAFVRSDIGFYRQLGVGGIILVLFYIFSIYYSIRLVTYGRMAFFLLVILLLSNFKQEAYNNSMLMYGVFILAAYLRVHDKLRNVTI
ncbi:TPA: hypothetical protein JD854_RS13775 [Citrobacter amalonaticus]|uniref:Wzy n=1 Tax=Citrobacter amalonaticus TaxID=35703 RepID=A0A9C7QP90_CITAM|nr:hypothetical protein [Citrobacter amalonaticus]